MSSKCLSRDVILKADDSKLEKVEVPEWGGHVYVRSISGTDRDAYEASLVEERGKVRRVNLANARAKLVALATCDEKGVQLFTPKDIDALGRKAAGPIDKLFSAAQRLSGLTDKDVEELAGN